MIIDVMCYQKGITMKISIYFIIAAIMIIIGGILVWCNMPKDSTTTPLFEPISKVYVNSDWCVIISIPPEDSCSIIKVDCYQDQGGTSEFYCKAVFKNERFQEYKFLAPWLSNVTFEKTDRSYFFYAIVPIDNVNERFLK